MNNKFETFIIFIIIIIIIYILYYSLYLANKKIEGLGRIKSGIDRGVKGARDLGNRGYKGARDLGKQFDPSKLIKDVKNLSRDVGGAFKKIGDLERLLDKAFKQLRKIEEIPKQVVNVAREVDRFPKMINKLVKEIEKNINVVDKVVDSLKDIVNVIEDEIKNAISKLEDAVKIAIDEIMKIKRGFLKFVKGVGNIFVQLFEIILKILYFIGDLPNCLIWYIIDAWDLFFRSIAPDWVLWFTDKVVVPVFKFILGIFKFILSIFGFDFNIDNKKCYTLDVSKQTKIMEKSFESVGDFFNDLFI